jgi:hypothetical protein
MTKISQVQIIPPTNADRSRSTQARAVSGEVRDLVVANSSDAGAFVRRPPFAHSGTASAGARSTVSAPFLAQHLDQEWIHRDSPADSRVASAAYAHATMAPAPRHDLAPPA